jgi:hypothetical protein
MMEISFRTERSRIGPHVALLRVLGAAAVAGLVLLVPCATARLGAWRLAASVLTLLVLGLLSSGITAHALGRLGASRRDAFRLSVPLAWPFSTPTAAARVLEHAARRSTALETVERLLGRAAFIACARPHAYDALEGADASPCCGHESWILPVGLAPFGADGLRAALAELPAPATAGSGYCVRCGGEYQADVAVCSDCGGLALAARRADVVAHA